MILMYDRLAEFLAQVILAAELNERKLSFLSNEHHFINLDRGIKIAQNGRLLAAAGPGISGQCFPTTLVGFF